MFPPTHRRITDLSPKSRSTLLTIETAISIVPHTHIISTTLDSCVVVAPSVGVAVDITYMLSLVNIHGKIIRGHFMDCYYVTVPYN